MTPLLQKFKKIIIPLFIATILGTLSDQWLTSRLEDQLTSPEGAGSLIWIWGGLSLLLNLTYPLITLLIGLSAMNETKTKTFVFENGVQTFLEQLRVWGKVLLWSFLFLLPGLIQFFRMIFVPFIVCFDPAYKNGRIDAIEKSKSLAQGKLTFIISLFILFSVLVPLLFTLVDDFKLLWRTPLSALAICFVEMFLNFCFIWCLWKVYLQQRRFHET